MNRNKKYINSVWTPKGIWHTSMTDSEIWKASITSSNISIIITLLIIYILSRRSAKNQKVVIRRIQDPEFATLHLFETGRTLVIGNLKKIIATSFGQHFRCNWQNAAKLVSHDAVQKLKEGVKRKVRKFGCNTSN